MCGIFSCWLVITRKCCHRPQFAGVTIWNGLLIVYARNFSNTTTQGGVINVVLRSSNIIIICSRLLTAVGTISSQAWLELQWLDSWLGGCLHCAGRNGRGGGMILQGSVVVLLMLLAFLQQGK